MFFSLLLVMFFDEPGIENFLSLSHYNSNGRLLLLKILNDLLVTKLLLVSILLLFLLLCNEKIYNLVLLLPPKSIKTVSFTIRKRGIHGSILHIYGSFSVRIEPYCIGIVNGPYLVVFTYFTNKIQLVVLQRIVTVNGPCLQRKLSKIRHELVIHRLALL